MRVDYVSVGPRPECVRIRFHPRLTVVGGLGTPERAHLARLVLAAMEGGPSEEASARFVDGAGSGVIAQAGDSGWRWVDDDGHPTESPRTLLGLDSGLDRRDGGHGAELAGTIHASDATELSGLHDQRQAVEARIDQVLAAIAGFEDLRASVAQIDDRIAAAVRRRTDTLNADLMERIAMLRAEAAGGDPETDRPSHPLASDAAHITELIRRWRTACVAVEKERERFGGRPRLDPLALADALARPSQVPGEVQALAAEYEAATADVAALGDRLAVLVTAAVGEPSHPAVPRLASQDQDELWSTAHAVVSSGVQLEESSLALGGVRDVGAAATIATSIDAAHDALATAEARAYRRRRIAPLALAVAAVVGGSGAFVGPGAVAAGVGVLVVSAWLCVFGPRLRLRSCRAAERAALDRAGAPSYLGFQVRRLEVNVNPRATEALELAALEHRRISGKWRVLAGDLDAAAALGIEPEVRTYSTALQGAQGCASEVADVRARMTQEAAPIAEAARGRLMAACEPFGIIDPVAAVELVRLHANSNIVARAQSALERVEQSALRIQNDLDAALHRLGFPAEGEGSPGSGPSGSGPSTTHAGTSSGPSAGSDDSIAALDRRVRAFEVAVEEAESIARRRRENRPPEVVAAELTSAEDELAERRARQQLDALGIGPSEETDPELLALRAERADAHRQVVAAQQSRSELERLHDRLRAIEHQIAAHMGPSQYGTGPDIVAALTDAAAAARTAGTGVETTPVILDEPFCDVHGDRKRAALGAVAALATEVQVLYLTDDEEVLAWARNRAQSGDLSVLAPAPESL
ncbi:MAG: hypothetical protein NVS3B21_14170 [Acidimicrobiales bacterium]